jgi:acyl carrier protein
MKELVEIVSETFSIDKNSIKDNLSREHVAEWDSFNHLLLIHEIEKQLGITFTMQEVTSIQDYKRLRELVATKQK